MDYLLTTSLALPYAFFSSSERASSCFSMATLALWILPVHPEVRLAIRISLSNEHCAEESRTDHHVASTTTTGVAIQVFTNNRKRRQANKIFLVRLGASHHGHR